MALSGIVLYVMPLLLVAHPYFYGWYELNYIVIHTTIVLSLIVFPSKFPKYFSTEYERETKHSFLAFTPNKLFGELQGILLHR